LALSPPPSLSSWLGRSRTHGSAPGKARSSRPLCVCTHTWLTYSIMILLGSCRGGGSQNLWCLCSSCDGVGIDGLSSAGSVGPNLLTPVGTFCCFSAMSSSLLILVFSMRNSSRNCFSLMLTCCWIRSSWVTSISFRWTFSDIRLVVSMRDKLAYMWSKSLVGGGQAASMLEVSG
jgi:hypothetical protein